MLSLGRKSCLPSLNLSDVKREVRKNIGLMIIGIFLLDKGLLPRQHRLVDPRLCGEVSQICLI